MDKKDAEIAILKNQLSKLPDIESQLREKDAQLAAKGKALEARLGGVEGDIEPIGGIGWGLCWAKFWQMTKQFDLVAPHALRSKSDQHGNRWSIMAFPRIMPGLTQEQAEEHVRLAEALGYDPQNPPVDEAFILHCQPDKGMYDIACAELEKAQKANLDAQRQLARAQQAVSNAIERGKQDLALKASQEADVYDAEVQATRQKYIECKAVIENAIQRYYLVSLDAFQRFDEYQMALTCHKATVVPQKRHQNLPEYKPSEEHTVREDGATV